MMRLLLLACLLAGLFSQKSNAQNIKVTIERDSTASPCDSCARLTANVQPGGLAYSYVWNTGETTKSIFVCFSGLYSVSIFGPNGISAVAETVVQLGQGTFPLYIASTQQSLCTPDSLPGSPGNCEKVCPFSTHAYSVYALGAPITSVGWQVTNALSWQVQNSSPNPPPGSQVVVTWGAPGSGQLTVTGYANTNCLTQSNFCVDIIEAPEAKFGSSPAAGGANLQICKGQTVYFQNQSLHADRYEWDFGNGQNSDQRDPNTTYNQPGTFKVRLIANSNCECSDTTFLTVDVQVGDAPSLDCVGTVCAGETVTYTASMSCGGYQWQISPNGTVIGGGGLTDDFITIKWADGPAGTIKLGALFCAGNTCAQPAEIHVPVLADNAEIEGNPRVCPASEEQYSIENYGGTNFVWTLSGGGQIVEGQGTSRIKVQWSSSVGFIFHHLSVKYDNCYLGCGGQDTLDVSILNPYSMTGPAEICQAGSDFYFSNYNNGVGPIKCNWEVRDALNAPVWNTSNAASPKITFPTDGLFKIIAKPFDPNQTCTREATWQTVVVAKPAKISLAGERFICPGEIYPYSVSGVTGSNSVSWAWQNGGLTGSEIGNKTTLNTWGAANPRWLAAAQRTHDGLGCLSDTTRLDIESIPAISFSGKSQVCLGESVIFTAPHYQSIDYQWSVIPADAGTFAEGIDSNVVQIFWQKPGLHTVKLTVCGQNVSQQITVFGRPEPAVVGPKALCPNFVDVFTTQLSTYTNWLWKDTNNLTISNLPDPDLFPGTYKVIVTDANGCTGEQEFTVELYPTPSVSATTPDPTGFCNNERDVHMIALLSVDGDYTYQWRKDGAIIPGATSISYVTSEYGDFNVEVVNQFGCPAKTAPINIFEFCGGGVCHNPSHAPKCPPGELTIGIDPNPICDQFQFHSQGGPNYSPGSAYWEFFISGGAVLGISTDENPPFTFPNAGHYIIYHQINLTNGATCKEIDSVRVRAVARFNVEEKCPGLPSLFDDVSATMPGEQIVAWSWNFDDPASGAANTSTGQNPTHAFSTDGKFKVKLTVTTASGCQTSIEKELEIPPLPPVNFAPPTANCVGNALKFEAAAAVTDIVWKFGEPASGVADSAKVSPAWHSYASAGNFNVNVSATNIYGCTSNFTQVVQVFPNTLAGAILAVPNPPLCEGKSTILTAPNGATTYFWSTGATGKTLTVDKEGAYTVTLTDSRGCTFVPAPLAVNITPDPDALIKAILKNEKGQITGANYGSLTVCEGEDVSLLAVGTGNGLSYHWSNNVNQATNDFLSGKNNLLVPGSYNYGVTITGTTGCTSTATFHVDVHPKPAGFFISTANFPNCAGTPTQIKYNGPTPAGQTYTWNSGDLGQTMTTKNAGEYFVVVATPFGCTAESNKIRIQNGPNLVAIPSGCHTRCRPDTLCFPKFGDVVSWQWKRNGTAIPGATSANFVATLDGAYSLQMVDYQGCTATSDPLTLKLYDGYGTITGLVWADVNGNGMIDAAGPDTLVSGIGVSLQNGAANVGSEVSNPAGAFAFANILSTNYTVNIDPATVPAGWSIIVGQQNVVLSGCDDFEKTGLLLQPMLPCPPSSGSLNLKICTGKTQVFNGVTFSPGMTQPFVLTNAASCDSFLTVKALEILPSAKSLNFGACLGSSYTYNSTAILAGQSKIFTFQNFVGCDSLVTVAVAVIPATSGSLQLKACQGSSATYNGTPIPAGQSQVFTLKNSVGCDSFLTVSVVVIPPTSGSLQLKACQGSSATYNGTPIPAGQSQVFTLKNSVGCDSFLCDNGGRCRSKERLKIRGAVVVGCLQRLINAITILT